MPGISGIGKKHIAVAVIAAFFLIVVLSCALRSVSRANAGSNVIEEGTIKYSLRWQGEDYEGTYTGNTVGGIPEGTGVFTDAERKITYSGDWESGKFDGNGSIHYQDGTREEGIYLEGKRHQQVRIYESDSHYEDGIYDYNSLYGCLSEYQEGKLKHETLIANGNHVSEIKKKAVRLTGDLIESREYVGQYVYITGEVVYTQESDSGCNFRVKSDSIGMVIGTYPNTSGYRSAQPMVLNMETGDDVTIYGFYTGTVRDELEADTDFYGYECVQIDPVYGQLSSGDNDRGSYASIRRNPFSYVGKTMEGEYIVDQYMKNDTLFYVSAHPAGEEDEEYVLQIEAGNDTVFYGGETLNLRGFIVGQRKAEDWNKTFVTKDGEELRIAGYKKFPVIRVISYELK